jgi:hypothetical protein
MAEFLTTASVLQCPHGGSVSVVSSNTHTKADGAFVLCSTDTFVIAGCPFTLPPTGPPNPCLQIQWMTTVMRSQVMSNQVLAKDSVGMCIGANGAPQGTVLIQQAQSHVKGT